MIWCVIVQGVVLLFVVIAEKKGCFCGFHKRYPNVSVLSCKFRPNAHIYI